MANIAQALREEIARVARREIKQTVSGLKCDTVWLKKKAAELKRRVDGLERENRLLKAEAKRVQNTELPSSEDLKKMRITGKMIRSLRRRLKVSQADLAALIGVTGQSVYQWERRDGSLRIREEAKMALQQVRKMSANEAREELGIE